MGHLMLDVVDSIPQGLLETDARGLADVLGGPTLLHLAGRRTEPLFVSVLLHGNEDTGLAAVQSVLRKHAGRTLPRALSIFFGNVAAARVGLRRLDGQPDYNRIWPGAEDAGTPEHEMAREVTEEMAKRHVFAAIDIHNNTGLNPHYACVNRLDEAFLHLATLFSRIVVHFTRPRGVLTTALAAHCPSVAIECGKPGNAASEASAAEFVTAALHLDHFPAHRVAPHDIDLYHTVGVVRVPDDVSLGFGREGVALQFDPDLDHLNFRDLPPGTPLGRVRGAPGVPLDAQDERGESIADRYFEIVSGELRTRRPLMPAMLTLDERVIRQDCLCYLMERTKRDDR
jgi:succinylglutamate desuccinylase